ncbi:hypothetical protein C7B70_20090 [Chlorogloea sp. CCALA 695]|nr:hypothetical protein C7B70_20090 [Chlorogloea sp. CCALA 695]
MLMIAINKLEKSKHLKFIVPQLWQGKAAIALEFSKHQVSIKNQDKWRELIGYLKKHQQKIINYNHCNQMGKNIGSERVLKGVDLTVGQWQKNKEMSWRPLGSKALCLLKVAKFNGQWQHLWLPPQAT